MHLCVRFGGVLIYHVTIGGGVSGRPWRAVSLRCFHLQTDRPLTYLTIPKNITDFAINIYEFNVEQGPTTHISPNFKCIVIFFQSFSVLFYKYAIGIRERGFLLTL